MRARNSHSTDPSASSRTESAEASHKHTSTVRGGSQGGKMELSDSARFWFRVGGVLGGVAVIMGAFGAHKLKSMTSDVKLLKTWETAAHYQLVQSAALLAVPFVKHPNLSGWLLASGTTLFSGSLYALVLTGIRGLGAITPIGGVIMIAGWLTMAL